MTEAAQDIPPCRSDHCCCSGASWTGWTGGTCSVIVTHYRTWYILTQSVTALSPLCPPIAQYISYLKSISGLELIIVQFIIVNYLYMLGHKWDQYQWHRHYYWWHTGYHRLGKSGLTRLDCCSWSSLSSRLAITGTMRLISWLFFSHLGNFTPAFTTN